VTHAQKNKGQRSVSSELKQINGQILALAFICSLLFSSIMVTAHYIKFDNDEIHIVKEEVQSFISRCCKQNNVKLSKIMDPRDELPLATHSTAGISRFLKVRK